MTPEEIRKNAPKGSTHYRKLSTGVVVYFKKNKMFYTSNCGNISYPRSFKEIKLL